MVLGTSFGAKCQDWSKLIPIETELDPITRELIKFQNGDRRNNCANIEALKVTNFDAVPEDYTGKVVKCIDGYVSIEYNHKRGKKDCPFVEWHSNGKLSYKINYKDGVISDDKVLFYNENGELFRTIYYENGKMTRCTGDCRNY